MNWLKRLFGIKKNSKPEPYEAPPTVTGISREDVVLTAKSVTKTAKRALGTREEL